MPDQQTATTGLARVAPGLVGFLHFFVLGSTIPLLPLYLRGSLGFSWTVTGVILTSLPFSLLVAQVIVRTLSRVGVDVRLGLAVSHLLAAGMAMAAAFRVTLEIPVTFAWPDVFGLTVLYFALLAPSMAWLARVGDATTASGQSVIRSWRVWGAVGFIAPAWLCEAVLIRFPNLATVVESREILFHMAGWAGLTAAFSAVLLPEDHSEVSELADSEPATGTGTGIGMCLAVAVVLIVIVQRCHYVWNAPFFEAVMHQHDVGRQFVHRLLVADQVFELFGLFLLGTGVVLVGTRLMLVVGAFAWFGRAVLLTWMSQSELSGQVAMACLCGAQVLQGVAIAAFFGTLGVLLRLHHGVAGCRYQIMLVSVYGILGMLAGGCLADSLVPGGSGSELADVLRRIGFPSNERTSVSPLLPGWAMVWSLSALPSLLAVLLVVIAKNASSVSLEQLEHQQ